MVALAVRSSLLAAVFAAAALAATGDGTYYLPEGGLGSCGTPLQNTDRAVALPASFGKEHCGRTISITYGGNTAAGVVVADTCPECAEGSIDMVSAVFAELADEDVGRLHGVEWDFE